MDKEVPEAHILKKARSQWGMDAAHSSSCHLWTSAPPHQSACIDHREGVKLLFMGQEPSFLTLPRPHEK